MSTTSSADIIKEEVVADELVVVERDWTDAEEAKARRKLDYGVMVLICLAFFSLQIDRANISSATTGTIFKDVGITSDQSNTGQSLLLVMIVIFEIPSNVVLQYVGPARWLGAQMMAWALVATFQAWIDSPGSFFATRVLLGICESGFIPGAVFYMSQMYTSKEFAARAAYFWIGGLVGKASSPLIASKLLVIKLGSLHGWQILFLVNGLMSIAIAFLCILLLPRSVTDSRTLIPGVKWFNDREAYILEQRVILDNPGKRGGATIRIRPSDIFQTLQNWRLWILVLLMITLVMPLTAIALYNSRTVKALGFATSQANALASVGVWAGIPPTALAGWLADRTQRRGLITSLFVLPLVILTPIFYHYQATTKQTADKWTKYTLFELIMAFQQPAFINLNAWAAVNALTPSERSIGAALMIMASNGAQAIGSQMFRASDAPLYLKGMKGVIALFAVSFILPLVAIAVYSWSNKNDRGHAGKEMAGQQVGASGVEEGKEAVVVKSFKYCL
ncbi:MFS transporter [Pseudohyphozyma bogoriensis]|nr:MFS transporter [Pseudohyphozyma bogoriensis]